MAPYVLTAQADADLDGIFDYTNESWGPAQAHKYINQLADCAEALASGFARFTDLSHAYPKLQRMLCQHHYIFCQPRENAPPLIVAILHEKMDLMTRIAERLG